MGANQPQSSCQKVGTNNYYDVSLFKLDLCHDVLGLILNLYVFATSATLHVI